MINALTIKDLDEQNELMKMIGQPDFMEGMDIEEQLFVASAVAEFSGKIKGVIVHKAMREAVYE